MVSPAGELAQNIGKDDVTLSFRLGRDSPGTDEDESSAEVISKSERAVGSLQTGIEVVKPVVGRASRQCQSDQAHLDRAEKVADLAPARFTEPLGMDLAAGLDHDPFGAKACGLADLVAERRCWFETHT
jgi:hypothetical protein